MKKLRLGIPEFLKVLWSLIGLPKSHKQAEDTTTENTSWIANIIGTTDKLIPDVGSSN
jgi:hypothetical protein